MKTKHVVFHWPFFGKPCTVEKIDGVSYINDCVVAVDGNVSKAVLRDGTKRINDFVFKYCTSLTSITIPNSVTSIGSHAFFGCGNLTSITIPDGITSIGDYTFCGCKNLTSITIPDSVTNIGMGAFCYCTSLTSITIPDSVTSIGDRAFYGCTGLIKKGKFKATDKRMQCRDFQYEIKKQHHEDKAVLCERGFHYCTNAFDVLNYYSGEIGKDVRFFKIKTSGTSRKVKPDDSKRVCTDITLIEEIKSYKDLLN